MMPEQGPLSKYVASLLEDERGREYIETDLIEKGHDESFVKDFVAEAITLHNAKKRSQGLTLILIGAVICFASFLLTITSSFSHDSFPWVLYGLTSAGIIVIFAGFMKVF